MMRTEENTSGVGDVMFPMKRESGGNPERTRRCNRGVSFQTFYCHKSLNETVWEDGMR